MGLRQKIKDQRDNKDCFNSAARARRLPSYADLLKHFYAVHFSSLDDYSFLYSYGTFGMACVHEAIEESHKALTALSGQSFIEGSDRFILRQAVWACFDSALALDQIDQEIIEGSGENLKNDLHNAVDRMLATKGNQDYLESLLSNNRSSDDTYNQWFAERAAARVALIKELLLARQTIKEIRKQAEWMAASVDKRCILSTVTNEALAALRAEQVQMAASLFGAISQGVAESLAPTQQIASH